MKLQKGSCWQCSVVDSWSELNEKIYWLIDEWTGHHGVIKGDAFMLKGIWTVVAQVRKKWTNCTVWTERIRKRIRCLHFFCCPLLQLMIPVTGSQQSWVRRVGKEGQLCVWRGRGHGWQQQGTVFSMIASFVCIWCVATEDVVEESMHKDTIRWRRKAGIFY